MKKILLSIVVLASFMAVGCSVKQNLQTTQLQAVKAWYQDDTSLQTQLAAAVADARQLDSSKISHELMPVRKGYPGQEWVNIDGHDMVLCVTLVDSSRMKRFFGRDDLYRIDREMGTWVTLPAEWVYRKAAYEGLDSVAAHMRMIQMYGLSPDCTYDIMVEFYADPNGMFRPAHDPDITTNTVGLDFPSYANQSYTVGETNFREWYRYSVTSAYEDDSPLPWTQMGYTYDWHQGAPRMGLSEYIVTHHTLIKVKSRKSAWSFIKNI